MFGFPKEAVGAIVAALIAGLISLLGLIISKEQKVSEFRQAWIDGLRENVATIITHLEGLRGAIHFAQPGADPWQVRKDHFVAINQAITCVRLRLNPDDSSSKQLLTSLVNLETVAQSGNLATSRELEPAINEATERCRLVMKEEWNRVRAGESTYRNARYASIAAVVLASLALSYALGRELATQRPADSSTNAASEIRVVLPSCSQTPAAKPPTNSHR